jgi:hypothetical protein
MTLQISRMESMRFWARRQVSHSGRSHGTCIHINFHGTNRSGESHGGCDRRLGTLKRLLVGRKTLRHMFSMCVM